MDSKLLNICETFIENRDELRRILRSYNKPMHLMAAAVLTACGERPNEERILKAEQILKENEPETSPIRGAIKSVTATHMSMSGDEMNYYKDLKRTQKLIRVNTGGNDERYYLAAMLLSKWIDDMQEILRLIDKAGAIHEGMGKSSGFFTDNSGYVAAAFAATSHITNVREYIDEVRACTDKLSEDVAVGIIPEDLSMLLALLPEDTDAKCAAVKEIVDALKKRGIIFARDEELGTLGILAGLDMSPDEIAEAVHDADEYMLIHSGFDQKGNDSILRHVYSVALVVLTYLKTGRVRRSGAAYIEDSDALKRVVLMMTQSVVHIQMQYVNVEDLNI